VSTSPPVPDAARRRAAGAVVDAAPPADPATSSPTGRSRSSRDSCATATIPRAAHAGRSGWCTRRAPRRPHPEHDAAPSRSAAHNGRDGHGGSRAGAGNRHRLGRGVSCVAFGTPEKGVIEQFRIEHGPSGVTALIERALRLEPDPAEVRVVLETRHGLLVEALLDAGFTVVPVTRTWSPVGAARRGRRTMPRTPGSAVCSRWTGTPGSRR
jgi:hypothetical protein